MDDKLHVIVPKLLDSGSWQQAVDQSGYLRRLVIRDEDMRPGVPVSATLNGIAVTFTINRFEIDRTGREHAAEFTYGFSTTCVGDLENVTAGLIALLSYARACEGRIYLPEQGESFSTPHANFDAHVDALLAGAFDAGAEWEKRYPDRVET